MIIEIKLSKEEYEFLIKFLLKDHKNISEKIAVKKVTDNSVFVLIDDDWADEIRELAGDEVALHFDKNYELTKTGRILESVIDKFYKE